MSRVKRDRQTADRIAAELAAHADALSVRMLQVTVPIYQPAPPKDPYLVGSGVLVTLAGDRFLLTARHVLDWLDRGQVVVGISPEYASIAGTLWRIRANDAQSDSEDHIDLGLVQVRGGPWHTPSTRDRNHQRSYRDDENWPSLKGVSLSKLGAVSGLSRSACQKIRTGTLVRHPWHWQELKADRLNGDSRTWLPASEKRSKCRFSITEMSLSYH